MTYNIYKADLGYRYIKPIYKKIYFHYRHHRSVSKPLFGFIYGYMAKDFYENEIEHKSLGLTRILLRELRKRNTDHNIHYEIR